MRHRKQQPEAEDVQVLTTAQAAKLLVLHPVTMRRWRCEKAGPRYCVTKTGRIRYRLSDLLDWQAQDYTVIEPCRR